MIYTRQSSKKHCSQELNFSIKMNSTNKTYKILSYNVMSNSHLAGLLNILDIEKPDLVLLQELVLNTENLNILLASKQVYRAVSNVDESDTRKPGTGVVWHESLPVSQVAALELNQLQICYVGPYPIVNVYQPAGSDNGPDRRQFLRDQLFRVMRRLGTKLPIIGVNFNCVIL